MIRFLFLLALTGSCHAKTSLQVFHQDVPTDTVRAVVCERWQWEDTSRSRVIPLAVYHTGEAVGHRKVVVFSHGYGRNNGESYLKYDTLLTHIAACGYYVVSIQYELPTDALMSLGGNVQVVRKPFWERGEATLLYVIRRLRQEQPDLDFSDLTLIGHSNGGDISCLLATHHPEELKRLITLDHLRVPLPKHAQLEVTTIRASDTKADPGVLPDKKTREEWHIGLTQLENVGHSDMDDKANPEQRIQLLNAVDRYLPCRD